jgi:hypothetical protein
MGSRSGRRRKKRFDMKDETGSEARQKSNKVESSNEKNRMKRIV